MQKDNIKYLNKITEEVDKNKKIEDQLIKLKEKSQTLEIEILHKDR